MLILFSPAKCQKSVPRRRAACTGCGVVTSHARLTQSHEACLLHFTCQSHISGVSGMGDILPHMASRARQLSEWRRASQFGLVEYVNLSKFFTSTQSLTFNLYWVFFINELHFPWCFSEFISEGLCVTIEFQKFNVNKSTNASVEAGNVKNHACNAIH